MLFLQNNKQQYEKVLSLIEHGKKEGATLLIGGRPFGKKGYYIEPTIFTDVTVYRYNMSMFDAHKLAYCNLVFD